MKQQTLECSTCMHMAVIGIHRVASECKHMADEGGITLCTSCAIVEDRCQGCGKTLESGRDEKVVAKVRLLLNARDKAYAKAQKVYDKAVKTFRVQADLYDASTEAARNAYHEAIDKYEQASNFFYREIKPDDDPKELDIRAKKVHDDYDLAKITAGKVFQRWEEFSPTILGDIKDAFFDAKAVQFRAKADANAALNAGLLSIVKGIYRLGKLGRTR
ncbi:MAG: hypothetical protein K2Y22_06145 [Candidatus Obscuribacterales bacterium]|nr:hypothetical protein [Candidatus Obscuribacterales bacterium]